ncbi:MAG: hypothetical protein FOGNACKC_02863 [Anaerolineae bacterium]|nr:hypothetical protein [Anaerolineae bacterium]
MPLLSKIAVAWLAGIMLARWLAVPWLALVPPALLLAALLLLYRDTPRLKLAAILGLALLAGAFRFGLAQPTFDKNHIAFYNDGPAPVKITGTVADEPDVRDSYINLRLRIESIQQGDTAQPVSGLVLIRAPRYPARFYGDRLSVTGRLETPPVFDTFNYKDYLARFGLYSVIRRPRIKVLESGQGNPFWAAMYAFKTRASESINRSLAEPYASLLNGILLGIETGIPRALYESFNLTGTSHVIVISGSNISVIAAILLLLGQHIFGKQYAPPLAIIGIGLYTFLVGADAAVSRAAVMGLVFILAIWVDILVQIRPPLITIPRRLLLLA